MGSSYSLPAVNHPEIPFCILSFYWDQVQIFNADDHVVSILRNNLQNNYKGIQNETRKGDAYIFKCRGYPFSTSYTNDHKMFINCMCIVLKELSQAGYIKIFSGDMNWYIDYSAWFFYKSPNAVANNIEFCAVDLWMYDKLKLFQCPPEICDSLKYTVNENWRGIQKSEAEEHAYAIKIKGFPWNSSSGEDGVKNRILIMKILQSMAAYGWTLYSATNIDGHTDTMFFCRKRDVYISREFVSSIFAISLNANDRLRLINADGSVIEALKNVIEKNWDQIQDERDHYGSYEFKLKGTPWWARGHRGIPSVSLLCAIFTELRRIGWKVMMNLDISRSKNDKGVFFFVRMPPKDTHYCALSIKDSNHVFGVHINESIQQSLTSVFAPFFELKESSGPLDIPYAMKWTLKGSPWSGAGTSSVRLNGQLFVASMVNTMVGFNYHLCSSADISSVFVHRDKAPDYKPDGDTLFFALDDPPLNVGLFTDQPSFAPMDNFFSSSPPPPPPSYEILYAD